MGQERGAKGDAPVPNLGEEELGMMALTSLGKAGDRY